ncbi:heme A synthase [Leptolyngbya sp. FACHB-261]|uniref:COX15/CtaA family protein n=1 Tax=Leptolyngbya sp. FACHB-261 TaxID=2692806 RepID=UPI001688FEFE|nr:COX15/CtaA family protein [Leptolyngbya sp. FACHB-261]MBD2100115.1 heme A synthase [Leptolyngbya sp. FACHB-261]
MTDVNVLQEALGASAEKTSLKTQHSPWRDQTSAKFLKVLAFLIAGVTLFLIGLGGATRVMNAGLSCPDWPLCYGTIVPKAQMNLQVFLEWFHRLVASGVGLLTVTLAATALWNYRNLPRWVSGLSVLSLFLVLVQGLLGGLTVTELLRFDIVTAHLGTAMLFLSVVLVLAVGLAPTAIQVSRSITQQAGAKTSVGSMPWVALGAAITLYAQSLLGGLVASQWALHACLGSSLLCSVMNNHLLGIVPAVVAILAVVVVAWRTSNLSPGLRRVAFVSGSLLLLQLGLGLATFRLQLQVQPLTVAHLVTGVTMFGSLVVLTTLAWKQRVQLQQAQAS